MTHVPWSSGDHDRLANSYVSFTIDELVEKALEQPTLARALSYVATSEHERALRQAFRNARDGQRDPNTGALWDTLFHNLFERTIEAWDRSRERGITSDRIRDEAQKRFQERIAGRNLGELKEADILLAELIGGILDYIDNKESCGRD